MDTAPSEVPPVVAVSEGWKAGPNYQIIVPQLLKGAVIPFLGAGASMFHRNLLGGQACCPPSATELAHRLAKTAQLNGNLDEFKQIVEDLPRIASYFEHVELDRDGLRDELKSVFDNDFEPNILHRLLAQIAAKQPVLIITTNYDDMIERAFQAANVPYHLVLTAIEELQVKYREPDGETLEPIDPQTLKISLKQASIIYKMHGSVDRKRNSDDDHFVITEEDYVSFLGSVLVPPAISALFLTRRFLFLGYSLRDWNFRVMLSQRLQEAGKLKKSWAIQNKPNIIEMKLWEKKNVEIFDMDLLNFAQDMSDQVQQKLPVA
ncbi:MAG TPA: SIR2 family protein [Rhodospirillales bacterium]|nr:SIR2 family protein [Rhodospirillales bacterium]